MDRIELRGMSFQGRHGVGASEREHAQRFDVDVQVETDVSAAGRSDALDDTVDYRRIRDIAKSVVEGEPAKLIETLATRVADRVLELNGVAGVSVRVAKHPASMQPIEAAAVHIKRTRA
jgi:dihydroneopterin aldolase